MSARRIGVGLIALGFGILAACGLLLLVADPDVRLASFAAFFLVLIGSSLRRRAIARTRAAEAPRDTKSDAKLS